MVCARAITISILSNDPSQRDFFFDSSIFDFRKFCKSIFVIPLSLPKINLWINIKKDE